jgi:hypothetical protein
MRSALLTVLTLALAPAWAQSNRYLEAGIPDVSREWNGGDYVRAVQVLVEGKVSLPRLSDPQGAALLRRITSTGTFARYRDKSLPLDPRLEDFDKVYQQTNVLLKLYLAEPVIGGVAPHQELAALVAFLLQGSALWIDLIDEIIPTIPKDPTSEAQMAALQEMRAGLTQVFQGAEETLESQLLSTDDRSVILEAMESSLPKVKKAFPEEVRVELRKKLEEDKARFSAERDLQRLGAMIRELSV